MVYGALVVGLYVVFGLWFVSSPAWRQASFYIKPSDRISANSGVYPGAPQVPPGDPRGPPKTLGRRTSNISKQPTRIYLW